MRVACPWFEPVSEGGPELGPKPARAPLGTIFNGVCTAHEAAFRPSENLLREFCNFGYGRHQCPHFPDHSPADAVRFSMLGDRLVWILEKDYCPVTHGVLDTSTEPAVATLAHAFQKTCPNR